MRPHCIRSWKYICCSRFFLILRVRCNVAIRSRWLHLTAPKTKLYQRHRAVSAKRRWPGRGLINCRQLQVRGSECYEHETGLIQFKRSGSSEIAGKMLGVNSSICEIQKLWHRGFSMFGKVNLTPALSNSISMVLGRDLEHPNTF